MIISTIIMASTEGSIKAHKSMVDHKVFMFNEMIVLMLIYHLICFTDFVYDPKTRDTVGYSMIFITSLALVFNFGLVFVVAFKVILKKCYIKILIKMKARQ